MISTLIFVLLVLGIVGYWALRGRSPRHVWQICRYQGGGSLYTPRPMTEEKAVDYASGLGHVMHVDRDYHIIFYRS